MPKASVTFKCSGGSNHTVECNGFCGRVDPATDMPSRPWASEVEALLTAPDSPGNFALLGEATVYVTRGKTTPYHYVMAFPNGRWACSCKGFNFRSTCENVKEVRLGLTG